MVTVCEGGRRCVWVLGVWRGSVVADNVAETAIEATKRRASRRKGRSVIPAIGATNNPLRRTCAPILIAAAWRCSNENEGSGFYPLLRRKRITSKSFVVFYGRAEGP